ncbi:hypothetical protein NXS19_009407 [Fusarium pseudograminearum]|nr:hypothetical protein NXS19_009407 [Fusarium pseudograminearum]
MNHNMTTDGHSMAIDGHNMATEDPNMTIQDQSLNMTIQGQHMPIQGQSLNMPFQGPNVAIQGQNTATGGQSRGMFSQAPVEWGDEGQVDFTKPIEDQWFSALDILSIRAEKAGITPKQAVTRRDYIKYALDAVEESREKAFDLLRRMRPRNTPRWMFFSDWFIPCWEEFED